MNLLEAVQKFCTRTGLPKPMSVAASNDSQITQIMGLLNEVVEDIVNRWNWQTLVVEVDFTTISGGDQGNFFTICGLGKSEFREVINQTIFNRTMRLPVYGPLTPIQYQARKALPTMGPFYNYRIRSDRLLFDPPAAVGHLCAFEVYSRLAVASISNVKQVAFELDTDEFLLDEYLLLAGLRWKWKSEKGLDYAEEFRRYEEMGANLAANDGSKPVLSMSGGSTDYSPGILVPPGNWNVT